MSTNKTTEQKIIEGTICMCAGAASASKDNNTECTAQLVSIQRVKVHAMVARGALMIALACCVFLFLDALTTC